MTLVSDRGMPLLLQTSYDVPCITLENYEKWYNVFVVLPGDVVEIVPPDLVSLAGDGGLWIDHDYHPQLLHNLAKIYCGEVDHLALEVAAGRWVLSGHSWSLETGYIVDQEMEDTMYTASVDDKFKEHHHVLCCQCDEVAKRAFKIEKRSDLAGCYKTFPMCDEEYYVFNGNRHDWVSKHYD